MKPVLQLIVVAIAGFTLGSLLAYGRGTTVTLVAGGLVATAICTLYCILFLLHRIYVMTAQQMPNDPVDNPVDLPPSMLGFDRRGTLKIHSVFLQK